MSKFLAIGMTLPQVIDCVTVSAAEGLRLTRKGAPRRGFDADLTLFSLQHQPTLLVDAEKRTCRLTTFWCRWPRFARARAI